jgi:hypothetical protein
MTKEADILSFNTVDTANKGDELELFYNGASTGIFLQVLGVNADRVQDYQLTQLKEIQRKKKYAEKQGKEIDFEMALIDGLKHRSIDTAANRVIGWRGANGNYDEAKLKTALKNNPEWIDEIINFSNDLGK